MPVHLPILPLPSVLVPGLVLELNVSDARYQLLVQALMALPDEAPRQFGVVALRPAPEIGEGPGDSLPDPDPHPEFTYTIGCTAELREVTPYSDGRFDIMAVGERRFRMTGLDEEAGTPYPIGLVEFLDEPDGAEPGDLDRLRDTVVQQFAEYQRTLSVEVSELPEDPRVVSYLVSAATVLETPQRQELLEQRSTADRLRAETTLLRQERAVLGTLAALPTFEVSNTRISRN